MTMGHFINLFIAISITHCVLGLPTEEELTKSSKNMAPVMRTILTDIANELISRSTSNNQVLTLNISNLLILLLLKGILWGASYAANTTYPKSRSGESVLESIVTETEILLLLSYLMGNEEKNFECLRRVACEDPDKAKEYMTAGKLIMNTATYIGLSTSSDDKYKKILNQLNEAIQFKEKDGDCKTKYSCIRESENNV